MKKSIIIFFVCVLLLGLQNFLAAKSTPVEEENMKLLKYLVNEGYNKGNLDVVDKIVAPNYKQHLNGIVSEKMGPELVKENINFNRQSYDFTLTFPEVFAKENKAVLFWSYKGKHKKSGKQVSFSGVFIGRFEAGKMVEGWQVYDTAAVLQQIGYTLTPPAWAREAEKK